MINILSFSEFTESALRILRQPQQTLQWYIIPILLLFIYVVSNEVRQKNWNILLGACALWGMDLFNELWNSYVCFGSNFAPVWGTPMGVGNTAYLILIGYNVEISFMFFLLGISACMLLPKDKHKKILGINNRVFFAVVMTTAAVCIECFLNYAGILTWEYSWWSIKCPWLIWLIGYLPFFTMAFIVHDLNTRKKQFLTLGCIFGVDLILIIIGASIGYI